MTNKINIKYNNKAYTVWLNNHIFLYQPIIYTKQIPYGVTPQAYWYLHILHILHQHGLLNSYKNINKNNF